MSKNKRTSAKDIAFERERVRLHSVIRQKDEEIQRLTAELNQYKLRAESWEKTVKFLEGYIGIPTEQLLEDYERVKRISPTIELFAELRKFLQF